MRMYDIILKKRSGQVLSEAEIIFFIDGFVKGAIPDYQAASLMMAIFFQGLNKKETLTLTKAMVNSGDTINLSSIPGIKVDKHSTGGVGDKTSIVLGPLVAAAGVPVAKLSGRGLGHTGGTIDKLESFTGFNAELSEKRFIQNVKKIGIAIAAQTANLVPADKKLYALRDVTATVENMSLIAGSIMSKKLASGSDAIVLDVKCGDGAFMKDKRHAFELAKTMVEIGKGMGRKTVAVISNMEEPLGNAVGNSLEVIEAIETLKGNGPKDLEELCLMLSSQMLVLGKVSKNEKKARKKLEEIIASGKALHKLKELVKAQGGDARQVENAALLPKAKFTQEILAPKDGYVKSIKAESIGMAAMLLGAGRETKESKIDLAAGIYLHKKVGNKVKKGEKLATMYSGKKDKFKPALEKILSAYSFSKQKVKVKALILGIKR